MLESLKDLYISYPFLPVANPPEFFKLVKDIRLVVELPATDLLLGYKNNRNGNYVRAWFTGFTVDDDDDTAIKANIKVRCSQVIEQDKELYVHLYDWEAEELPHEQSYMLCSKDLINNIQTYANTGIYELNPSVLLLWQSAPKLVVGDDPLPSVLTINRGYNVQPNITNGSVSFYGAVDVGSGTYPINQPFSLSVNTQALGARSINGLQPFVTIDCTPPIRIEPLSGSTLSVWLERGL